MVQQRSILESIRSNDVTIPFLLRVVGAGLGLIVIALAVGSALAAGHARRDAPGGGPSGVPGRSGPRPTTLGTMPLAPTHTTSPSAATASHPTVAPAVTTTTQAPTTAAAPSGPTAAANAFVTAYGTWRSPDGPPGAAARVVSLITPGLFAHFPPPSAPTPAPSAVALIISSRVASTNAGRTTTATIEVSFTQHLLAQDGTPLGTPPQPSAMTVTVQTQAGGPWLVEAFTTGDR